MRPRPELRRAGFTRRRGAAIALVSTLGAAAHGAEAPTARLIARINDFRASGPVCGGKRLPPAPPLAQAAALANVQIERGSDLQGVLKAAGYHAARAQAIALSGVRSTEAAVDALATRYCEDIARQQYTEIGVARDGNRWRIVLAQPLLASDLADWPDAGREVLRLTNEARNVPRRCGDQRYSTAPPLKWNPQLARAARTHSLDMAKRNALSHAGSAGRQVGARAEAAGYDWRAIGENIATGQGSPERVVAGWLASPSHCANIMSPRFDEMGAAYALNMGTETGIFWTQVFGASR